MRHAAILSAIVLALSAATAMGEDPFLPGPGEKRVAGADAADESQKVADIEAQVAAGKYDDAIEAAGTFIRKSKDSGAKADATRLVADALRKKQDWKRALAAYMKLRDCYDKGSDEYVRFNAMVDILRAAPAGVYAPLAQASAAGAPTDAVQKNLADDAVMAEALSQVAGKRLERVKMHIPPIGRGRTAQEVVKLFAAVADELRQVRVLWPDMPPDAEREAAQTAGLRLAELGKQSLANMNAKSASFRETIANKRLGAAQRKEMEKCQEACKDAAKTEEAFVTAMGGMTGLAGWTEGDQLKTDSADRAKAFGKLAEALTPPPPTGGGRGDWGGDWGRGPGGGGGGGGGGRGR